MSVAAAPRVGPCTRPDAPFRGAFGVRPERPHTINLSALRLAGCRAAPGPAAVGAAKKLAQDLPSLLNELQGETDSVRMPIANRCGTRGSVQRDSMRRAPPEVSVGEH